LFYFFLLLLLRDIFTSLFALNYIVLRFCKTAFSERINSSIYLYMYCISFVCRTSWKVVNARISTIFCFFDWTIEIVRWCNERIRLVENTYEWRSKRRHTRDNGPVLAAYRRSFIFFVYLFSFIFFGSYTHENVLRESTVSRERIDLANYNEANDCDPISTRFVVFAFTLCKTGYKSDQK